MLHKNESRIAFDELDGYVRGKDLSNVIFRNLQNSNKVGVGYSYRMVLFFVSLLDLLKQKKKKI